MPRFTLNTEVVLFNHEEYGQRLLFKNGITNPRDQLGKNGVTVHGYFSSFFYSTIEVQARIQDKSGVSLKTFYVNRNSLIKYMGEETYKDTDDAQLISALCNNFLWKENNNNDEDQKAKQVHSGEHGLRHAGRHNTRPVDNWRVQFVDYIKGSFLGWLYKNTIVGVNAIKARFLFVSSEADLFDAGEILAKRRFHEANEGVPAYKNHVTRFNGIRTSETQFWEIPETNKSNYIKFQDNDSDTHFGGVYPAVYKKDTSTGTSTGIPTEWVRGEKELQAVRNSLKLATKIQFGDRKLNYVNAFALGPWATGLTTVELMRETGSIFATGADKEKILDHLISNRRYELHQAEIAVDKLLIRYPYLKKDRKQQIIVLIDESIKTLLKNRDSSFKVEFDAQFERLARHTQDVLKHIKDEIKEVGEGLNKERNQVIIAGYPPFLKDLVDYVKQKGHNISEFSAIGIVGGQAISEASRDQLIQHGFNQIYSSYGASDLDINLGVETEYEITVRKAIEKNPGLARELFGENKGLPMVFHYDPMNYHVECKEDNDLIFTCTRDDRSSPRIRYNLGDKGRVYASSDVQALLTKYGIFQKPKTNLPLMFVWGRDSTVVFVGANLAFTELDRAVTTDTRLEAIVLKKAFYAYKDTDGQDKFEIWLELNDGVELPDDQGLRDYSHSILNNLVCLNQDFKYQVNALTDGTELPRVRFFKRGQSPISEAGGHRKQVLIFNKETNLDKDYQFPAADKSVSFALPKTSAVMSEPASLRM